MTDRQGPTQTRPHPSIRGLDPSRLTVAEVLALDPVRAGEPQVLAGHGALDRPVRWLHVAESPTAARFLEGGELVLTTGTSWPEDAVLGPTVDALIDAGAIALVVELGARYTSVPDPVVERCRARDVPLVALHREVSFVAITETGHKRMVAAQLEALQSRDQVQALFSELNRTGASPDHIVTEVAQLLGGPVVLEDLAHRVVWCAPHGRREAEVLRDWAHRSRAAGAEGAPGHRWRAVPVAARGRRWGRLIAVDDTPELSSSAADLVLTQGALALSLGAMAAAVDGTGSWDTLRQRGLIESLLGRRFASRADGLHLLETAGLPVWSSTTVGLGWTVDASGLAPEEDRRWPDTVRQAAERVAGPLRATLACSTAPAPTGAVLGVLVLPRDLDPHSVVDTFAERLRATSPVPVPLFAAGVPAPAGDFEALLRSLGEAHDLLVAAPRGTGGVLRVGGQEVEVLASLLPARRLDEFVEEVLGPVLTYDVRHGTDLQSVLSAYLDHPGNRTRAAQESHLSRSAFYQRLELIESLLGRDLHQGSTVAALHVAMLVHHRRGAR